MSSKAHLRFVIAEILLLAIALTLFMQRLSNQHQRIEAIETIIINATNK